ncbi:MAG: hypothetical protein AAFY71_24520 [Bacteroidota bacterium]
MKYFQVLSKKTFTLQGEEQTKWYRVGEIKVTPNGGKYLKLFLHPNTDFAIVAENQEDNDLAVIE